jgi:XTP/dITP diphosphohydrolase
MSRIVIASNNPGKLREFAALFAPLGFETVAQGVLGIGDAEEPFDTFVENALTKARHATRASGLPALADDSGLCVDALDGDPGVRSARYADSLTTDGRDIRDQRNNAKLIGALVDCPDRAAHYLCCLVFLRHVDDPEPIVAVGRWAGRIVDEPRGANGFGYDPHFLLPELDRTAAELDPAIKNRISHRAVATQRLLDELVARGDIDPSLAPPRR